MKGPPSWPRVWRGARFLRLLRRLLDEGCPGTGRGRGPRQPSSAEATAVLVPSCGLRGGGSTRGQGKSVSPEGVWSAHYRVRHTEERSSERVQPQLILRGSSEH